MSHVEILKTGKVSLALAVFYFIGALVFFIHGCSATPNHMNSDNALLIQHEILSHVETMNDAVIISSYLATSDVPYYSAIMHVKADSMVFRIVAKAKDGNSYFGKGSYNNFSAYDGKTLFEYIVEKLRLSSTRTAMNSLRRFYPQYKVTIREKRKDATYVFNLADEIDNTELWFCISYLEDWISRFFPKELKNTFDKAILPDIPPDNFIDLDLEIIAFDHRGWLCSCTLAVNGPRRFLYSYDLEFDSIGYIHLKKLPPGVYNLRLYYIGIAPHKSTVHVDSDGNFLVVKDLFGPKNFMIKAGQKERTLYFPIRQEYGLGEQYGFPDQKKAFKLFESKVLNNNEK